MLEPAVGTVAGIARATGFPIGFFNLGALPDMPEGRFRRLARGTSKDAKRVRAQVRQVVEIVDRADSTPGVHLPSVLIEPITELSDIQAIETLALRIRSALGVGATDPIPNVIRALERAGIIVIRLPGDAKDHSGFSTWPSRPLIALMAGNPGDRDRFTTAHELGHLILHTQRPFVESKQAEAEANRFAGAFLLPKQAAREAFRPPITLRVLMGVKAAYGISIAAAARRALDLNLITQPHYVSIQKQISARKWRKNEPVDVPQERTILIAKAVDAIVGEGSTAQRASRLGVPVFTLRAIEAA